MANGFVHKDQIKILMEQFAPYFNRYLDSESLKVQWVFPQEGLGGAEISRQGDKELKIIKTEFYIKEIGGIILDKIKVDLIEDNEGTFSIKVNGKLACSIESRGRMDAHFLKSLARSIKDEI